VSGDIVAPAMDLDMVSTEYKKVNGWLHVILGNGVIPAPVVSFAKRLHGEGRWPSRGYC